MKPVDNSARSWAPRAGLVGAGWVLAVAATAGAVLSVRFGDRPGTLLLTVAALALLAAALHGTLLRPRLTADGTGLLVRTLSGTRRFGWHEVRLTLSTVRRFGREVTVLEVEPLDLQSPDLVVLGWTELGADPRDVHEELLALRPA
ncbi:apolipoprotein N-acyltransferase [Saccharomonospora marina XMU15]|uniref:Apolipoprotein N-acyltransferase n=1 Tax=Saccharomonospora marina XMU15 TaxID=882083 RepID=H5WZA7_9PSEU|nr:PH domain-containing protein [Saccharomonospora marina]EHR48510.1 apolipoprotein N-acyltransferase [Saccharomonospora marina XMU15]